MNQRQATVSEDLGDPQLAELRAAREQGDLTSTLEALRATRGVWDRRWLLLSRVFADVDRGLFDQLVLAHPGDPLAYLLRGVHAIQWGWQARGTGWGEGVSADAARLLKERLHLAEADLRHCAALDPSDPNPWSFLLTVGLGLGSERAIVEHAFSQARSLDPEFMPAYRTMQEFNCAKWYGSEEQMFGFARASAQGAPMGSERHALIVRAHQEQFFVVDRAHNRDAALAYGGSVRNEIMHARAMSVGSSQHQRRAWSDRRHQALARWWYLNHDRRSLADELEILGDRIDPEFYGGGKGGLEVIERMRRYASDADGKERRAAQQKKSNRNTLMGVLGVFGFVAFLIVFSIGMSAYNYLSLRVSDRVWVRNSSAQIVAVSVDGGAPRNYNAWQSRSLDLGPGRHTVRATVVETGEVFDDGDFTMPERTMGGLYGHTALYDLGGAGRYVAAHVTWDGARPVVRDLGMDGHLVVFPEGYTDVATHFADAADRNKVSEAVCARTPEGRIPCLE